MVASAMGGVTDRLVQLYAWASAGEQARALGEVERVYADHRCALDELRVDADMEARIDGQLRRLRDILAAAIRAPASLAASSGGSDYVASFGDRLSVRVLVGALHTAGLRAESVDASDFLVTTAEFGRARPLMAHIRPRARARLLPLMARRTIPVVTGFIGATVDGQMTTLGRNGSDYSATIIAHALDAREVDHLVRCRRGVHRRPTDRARRAALAATLL